MGHGIKIKKVFKFYAIERRRQPEVGDPQRERYGLLQPYHLYFNSFYIYIIFCHVVFGFYLVFCFDDPQCDFFFYCCYFYFVLYTNSLYVETDEVNIGNAESKEVMCSTALVCLLFDC